MPTGENLARFIYDRVQQALGSAATVTRVTVSEDASLSTTHEPG
jgi:6-pyruvoyl-tetrahydropterin synthase